MIDIVQNKPANGTRGRIYPKIVKGKLYIYRNRLSYLLLALMFAAPLIKIRGEQLLLFNILERKFVIFGIIFWPQDFHIFVLGMLVFFVFIILFTVVFGRIWCGWACPQTIFMEMLFRKIEFWIEGGPGQQKKLDTSPLTPKKFLKKAGKHLTFILISFAIANVFLAYIIGTDSLIKIIKEPILNHVIGFSAILAFTTVFYFVFARVRELVCTVICPYGRLQGVLLDSKSLVVAYDSIRGEPRQKLKRNQADNAQGDCVDCSLCVQVCPTGIDIRQGTQLECINCTLCIDACDMVMAKIKKPERLIGFKSQEQIINQTPFKFSRRIYAYAFILVFSLAAFIALLSSRKPIETIILRASGTLYQERPNGMLSNLYNAEFINKTSGPMPFSLAPVEDDILIQFIRKEDVIPKGQSVKATFFVIRSKEKVSSYKSEIDLKVLSKGKLIETIRTNFIAPIN